MNQQLTIFDAVGDTFLVSPTDSRGDSKIQHLERFCDKAKRSRPDRLPVVKTYTPGRRKTEYYRLDYWQYGKPKSIHIPGGNIRARLATYRAKQIQKLIDRGAELGEIIAAVETYRLNS